MSMFLTCIILMLCLFFSVVIIKKILFWLYLWQMKEYHIGRFLDHFNTAKGKELLVNKVVLLKVLFVLIAVYSGLSPDNPPNDTWLIVRIIAFLGLFFAYGIETLKIFKDLIQKNLKKPIFTKKTVFLFLTSIISAAAFIYFIFIKGALGSAVLFDLFIPLIISLIVLLFQPLAVLGRNRIIKKAKRKRAECKDLLVIGITGSYGKTSTKEFLYTILAEKFGEQKVLKTEKHQNSEVGISQCILNNLKPEHEIFICEMGAYNRRGIKLLCDIVKPKIGILTGINEQHMATFGSQENIIKTKFELIQNLPADGVAVFNGDNAYCMGLYLNTGLKKKVYSLQSLISGIPPDVWAYDKIEKEYIIFKAVSKDGESAEFKVNILGAHNILNILGAVAVAKELGMSLQEIAKACEKIKPEVGAMRLLKGINGLNIIDSTYSANPDGMISDLEYLKIWSCRKVIVMPCLIELGKASKDVHRRIGQKIGEVCDLAIITTKDRFKEIKETAGDKAMFIENPKKILEKIKGFTKEGDVVLLESRLPKILINLLSN